MVIGLKKRKSATKQTKRKHTSRLAEGKLVYGTEATGMLYNLATKRKLNWGQIKNNNLTQHSCMVEL